MPGYRRSDYSKSLAIWFVVGVMAVGCSVSATKVDPPRTRSEEVGAKRDKGGSETPPGNSSSQSAPSAPQPAPQPAPAKSPENSSPPASIELRPWVAGAADIGGSNYPMWSIGEYAASPTEENWYKPGVLKPVIGTYHENPAGIRDQLRTMYNNGQRRIALFLWYADGYPDSRYYNDVYGHLVNPNSGRLSAQHRENLINLLNDVRSTGFTHLQFRFASQGGCEEGDRYRTCWSFLTSTIQLVVDHTSRIDVVFDLDNEAGGSPDPRAQSIVERYWRDFNKSELKEKIKTYGFSIAAGPGRITKYIQQMEKYGSRPFIYALTVYDDGYQRLKEVANELYPLGELGKGIIVQETFYNDRNQADEFLRASRDFGLPIRFVMQWPMTRGGRHFTEETVSLYAAYGGAERPTIDAAGIGCANGECVWIKGKHFEQGAHVDVREREDGEIIASYDGTDRNMIPGNDDTTITFRIKSPREKELLRSGGLLLWVVNPNAKSWNVTAYRLQQR
jgi:hypothetical protein